MKQSSKQLEKFSSQIRFALENYTPHGIDKNLLNAVLICGTGGSGVAGRIVKDYFQDKLDLPIGTAAGYLMPRYAGPDCLVVVWSHSGENEEALALYDIARERGCRLIVISSGGRLSEKAREDEVILYPVEAGLVSQPGASSVSQSSSISNPGASSVSGPESSAVLTSGMALGYALGYQFQIIFELLGVYKKPDLIKIADKLDNASDYRQQSAEIAGIFQETRRQKFIVVCDAFFEGAAIRFCQQLNQAAGIEAFVNVLPEGGYHVLETYKQQTNNQRTNHQRTNHQRTNHLQSNFIFLNSRLSLPVNLRFSAVKDQLEKTGIKPVELLVADSSLDSLFHIVHLLDWVALQVSGIEAPALAGAR